MKVRYFFVLLCFVLLPVSAGATIVAREGTTYPIAEKDLRELIAQKAKDFDFEGWKLKEQQRLSDTVTKFRPADAVSGLPPSTTGQAYQVDLTYSLPFDLQDINGNIIYPKGFTYNPLSLMRKKGVGLSKVYVVLNGTRENELKWFTQKFADYRASHITVLLTDGYAIELGNALKRPVRYLTTVLQQRFNIRETPSVIVQSAKADTITVKPYALDRNGKEIRQSASTNRKRNTRR